MSTYSFPGPRWRALRATLLFGGNRGTAGEAAAANLGGVLPSDNRESADASELSGARFVTGGRSVAEALATLTARAGMAVQNDGQAEAFSSVRSSVSSLRESMSGVNSDERWSR